MSSDLDSFKARLKRLDTRHGNTPSPMPAETGEDPRARASATRGAAFPLTDGTWVPGRLRVGHRGGIAPCRRNSGKTEPGDAALREAKGPTGVYLSTACVDDPFLAQGLGFILEVPHGWGRITGIDVRDQSMQSRLETDQNERTRFRALPGLDVLTDFMAAFDVSDMALHFGRRTHAPAIYLSQDSPGYMDVTVDIQRRALGEAGEPEFWFQALRHIHGGDEGRFGRGG